jgi:hypothetical protein
MTLPAQPDFDAWWSKHYSAANLAYGAARDAWNAALAARSTVPEAGKAVAETALMAEMLAALKQAAAQFSQYTEYRRLTAYEQFAFDSARLAIAKFEANR